MNLIEILNDIPINSPVKILVYKDNALIIDFMTKVKSRIDDEELGPGVSVKAVYLQNKKVYFKDFTVSLQYRGVDNRDYFFEIKDVRYDYDNDLIRFYSRRKAKVENKRDAYRFSCDYRLILHLQESAEYFIGNCKDISYAGVGCYVQDPEHKLSDGTPVYLDIYAEDHSVEHLPGKIVRMKQDMSGSTNVFLGISTKKEKVDFSAMIQRLQVKMLKAGKAKHVLR